MNRPPQGVPAQAQGPSRGRRCEAGCEADMDLPPLRRGHGQQRCRGRAAVPQGDRSRPFARHTPYLLASSAPTNASQRLRGSRMTRESLGRLAALLRSPDQLPVPPEVCASSQENVVTCLATPVTE